MFVAQGVNPGSKKAEKDPQHYPLPSPARAANAARAGEGVMARDGALVLPSSFQG